MKRQTIHDRIKKRESWKRSIRSLKTVAQILECFKPLGLLGYSRRHFIRGAYFLEADYKQQVEAQSQVTTHPLSLLYSFIFIALVGILDCFGQ